MPVDTVAHTLMTAVGEWRQKDHQSEAQSRIHAEFPAIWKEVSPQTLTSIYPESGMLG